MKILVRNNIFIATRVYILSTQLQHANFCPSSVYFFFFLDLAELQMTWLYEVVFTCSALKEKKENSQMAPDLDSRGLWGSYRYAWANPAGPICVQAVN